VGKAAQAVEVTEEFVSTVDEMNDHFGSMLDLVASLSKAVEKTNEFAKKARRFTRSRNQFALDN
jgi:TorA maturation chaperone TorD